VVGGEQPGQGVVAERNGDGRGERLPGSQGAGHLAGRVNGYRADSAGADVG
jgi:hypothetical protein